ncbi:MAG TPA: S4 domain-containing protein [Bacillota bacterium]|mgnify:FL=1|nr:S4 domain-containing protein [Bacillota bacterium]
MSREKNDRSGIEAGTGAAAPAGGGKEISGTVAALRLDAVLALGFGISRARAVILIKGGLVQVNGRLVETPSCRLNRGDRITVRGRGSVEIAELTGKSRKGRLGLRLNKLKE